MLRGNPFQTKSQVTKQSFYQIRWRIVERRGSVESRVICVPYSIKISSKNMGAVGASPKLAHSTSQKVYHHVILHSVRPSTRAAWRDVDNRSITVDVARRACTRRAKIDEISLSYCVLQRGWLYCRRRATSPSIRRIRCRTSLLVDCCCCCEISAVVNEAISRIFNRWICRKYNHVFLSRRLQWNVWMVNYVLCASARTTIWQYNVAIHRAPLLFLATTVSKIPRSWVV